LSSGVLVPKKKHVDKSLPSAITILVDVSGSVDSILVYKSIKAIFETAGYFDKKHSHIIQWDTNLCSDNKLNETVVIKAGGGTNIAKGINYAKKYLKTKWDKLFIISDCYDNLKEWTNAAKSIKGFKMVLGYELGKYNPSLKEVIDMYANTGKDDFYRTFDILKLDIGN
jgi:predicted metal-dependent peptidase